MLDEPKVLLVIIHSEVSFYVVSFDFMSVIIQSWIVAANETSPLWHVNSCPLHLFLTYGLYYRSIT